jgi:hypothetical protein
MSQVTRLEVLWQRSRDRSWVLNVEDEVFVTCRVGKPSWMRVRWKLRKLVTRQ